MKSAPSGISVTTVGRSAVHGAIVTTCWWMTVTSIMPCAGTRTSKPSKKEQLLPIGSSETTVSVYPALSDVTSICSIGEIVTPSSGPAGSVGVKPFLYR